MALPLARTVVKDLAAEHGACLRPVQLRRTDIDTGHVEQVLIPCGHTLASVCPSCAERARILRAAQCREGWHLDCEPVIDPDPATQEQRGTITDRAEAQADRDALAGEGLGTGELDERIGELDQQITDAGMRGTVLPARPRRHRSTRRRQDAAPLPRRPVSARTVGKTYTAPDGKTFRPSLFVTLTCPSYGRVGEDGAPADPDTYDYTRAARDALHFAALFDRFIQNLRRYTGYDLQYFAAIEPQRRLAPHVHLAIRGTISRTELREVIAATYHQVWWPSTETARYDGGCLPVWDEHTGTYLDPDTGEVLPTWDQALDAISDRACRGTTTSRRRRRPSFSNWEGSVTTQNPKAAGPSGEDAAFPLHGARPRRQMSKGLTLTELLALPLMVDVSTAARALGLSRSTAYELARRGEFPCRVLHVGSSYRVPTAELLRVLGIDLSELSPRFPAA